MDHVVVACGPFPPARKRYKELFNCVELSEMHFETVRPATLAEWRAAAADSGFEYIPVAWQWLSVDPLDDNGTPPHGLASSDLGFFSAERCDGPDLGRC